MASIHIPSPIRAPMYGVCVLLEGFTRGWHRRTLFGAKSARIGDADYIDQSFSLGFLCVAPGCAMRDSIDKLYAQVIG